MYKHDSPTSRLFYLKTKKPKTFWWENRLKHLAKHKGSNYTVNENGIFIPKNTEIQRKLHTLKRAHKISNLAALYESIHFFFLNFRHHIHGFWLKKIFISGEKICDTNNGIYLSEKMQIQISSTIVILIPPAVERGTQWFSFFFTCDLYTFRRFI